MKTKETGILPESEYFIHSPGKTALGLFLYPLECGRFFYEKGYRLRRSSFDSFLIIYTRSGSLLLNPDSDRETTVPPGSFILLDCYHPHSYGADENCECLWCHFDGVQARSFYQLITGRLGTVFRLPDPVPVLRKLETLLEIFQKHRPVEEVILSRYLYDILAEFASSSPETKHSDRRPSIADSAAAYLNEHFSENISVRTLADRAGLSPYYFIRIFRRETGYSPHEYLIRIRMAHARYFLSFTDLPVKEICFSVGYSSESVFASAFKKEHGKTPSEYRSSQKETADSPS